MSREQNGKTKKHLGGSCSKLLRLGPILREKLSTGNEPQIFSFVLLIYKYDSTADLYTKSRWRTSLEKGFILGGIPP
jgi:hypothetical protein